MCYVLLYNTCSTSIYNTYNGFLFNNTTTFAKNEYAYLYNLTLYTVISGNFWMIIKYNDVGTYSL